MTPFIEPDWPAPANICALSTTREGGVSTGPWRSFNLGDHVGDDPAAVAANRERLLRELPTGARVQWLNQVHGVEVVCAGQFQNPQADACWTAAPGRVCAVMTADCLPVLFCDRAGTAVAAAHAGWRGLCAGVLEATVAAMPCTPAEVMAWLGPAIGPSAFEVGAEVRAAFVVRTEQTARCFGPSRRRGHYLADIYQLARQRLAACGVREVHGVVDCTYSDAGRFFSYRRDGRTGRMATVICLTKQE